MNHSLDDGQRCNGHGKPCDEPGCIDRGHLPNWETVVSDVGGRELARLSRLVVERLGTDVYDAALIRANAIAGSTPNNPEAMHLALLNELKRLTKPR